MQQFSNPAAQRPAPKRLRASRSLPYSAMAETAIFVAGEQAVNDAGGENQRKLGGPGGTKK